MSAPAVQQGHSRRSRRSVLHRVLPGSCLSLVLGGLVGSCGDANFDLIVRDAAQALECQRDSDCPLDRGRCNVNANRCVGCLLPEHCQSGQTCNVTAGSCVQDCNVGEACSGVNPVCDAATGMCRACGSDLDCDLATPHCDLASGRCDECISNDDCRGERRLCAVATGRCVECLTNGHCEEEAERCSQVLGECGVPCPVVGPCPSDDPICDQAIGFCVECSDDADCVADQVCRSSDCVDFD